MENVKRKTKKQKKINGLPKSMFDRLQFIIAFEENPEQLHVKTSIMDLYAPRLLNSCDISSYAPRKPLDIEAFRRGTIVPGHAPYFKQPKLPSSLPSGPKKPLIYEVTYPSIVPLLLTANHCGVDTRSYHFISQRNSFRKLAMNDEKFVINAVRFGSTIFLRRFSRWRMVDKNNVGFSFEEMCTTKENSKSDYNQLIDGNIGKFRILMMGETDAINRGTGESIELKCQKSDPSKYNEYDWWLQAYLCK